MPAAASWPHATSIRAGAKNRPAAVARQPASASQLRDGRDGPHGTSRVSPYAMSTGRALVYKPRQKQTTGEAAIMTATPSRRRLALCNCGLSHGHALNRRDLLAGGAAALFAAAMPSGLLPKASAQAKQQRIDVHHHIVPPTWQDMLK